MSIASELYANYANRVKRRWQTDLRKAIKNKDWSKVKIVLRKMENYQFTE